MKSCHVTLCYIVVLRRNYFYYSYWIEKLYGRVIGCAVTFVQLALVLATLGTPVLEPNLNPRLAQTESLAKFFPHERVRVMGLVEQSFQLGQLFQGEIRSRSSLFPVSVPVVPAIRPWKKIFQRDDFSEKGKIRNLWIGLFLIFQFYFSSFPFQEWVRLFFYTRIFKSRERSRGNSKFNHRIIVHRSFPRRSDRRHQHKFLPFYEDLIQITRREEVSISRHQRDVSSEYDLHLSSWKTLKNSSSSPD